MRRSVENAQSVVILILSGSLFITGTSGAQVFTPIAQDRSVSTENVNAPQCNGDFLFDGDAAVGFGPFDGFVKTNNGCDSGTAVASAGQQSQIDAASMSGVGTAYSEAHGPIPGVVHAFGISDFEVTFDLPSASNFTLEGVMSAASFPDGNVGAVVLVRLWVGPVGGVLVFQDSVTPLPGGKVNSKMLDGAGVLQADVYTLDVQAGTFMDNDVPPSRSAQASFDFTFNVSIRGDIDGDGSVGTPDLLLLLGAWGACRPPPEACPGDLDGDGCVGVRDLLILLGNWG